MLLLKAPDSLARFGAHDAVRRSRVLAKATEQLLNRLDRLATRGGDPRFRRSPILRRDGMPKAQSGRKTIVLDRGSDCQSDALAGPAQGAPSGLEADDAK